MSLNSSIQADVSHLPDVDSSTQLRDEIMELGFYWARAPSLLTDPHSQGGYFAQETMLCLDDFEYPSWQEFNAKLRVFERDQDMSPAKRFRSEVVSDDVSTSSDTPSIQTPLLSPSVSRESSPLLSVSTDHKAPLLRIRQFENVPVTVSNVVCQFTKLTQPFTLKRVLYMEWVKPFLLEHPPAKTSTPPKEIFNLLFQVMSPPESEFLVSGAAPGYDLVTFLASLINKLMLLHFLNSGEYHINRYTREDLAHRLTKLLGSTSHQVVQGLVDQRVKHFRDVMARQFRRQKNK
eukprot:Blabericola_migrator_1__13049@NODE_879_length_6197_cov_56_342251_g551_i2_p3_GENE_NODE_879_length_6197_cov_56_342251_g551_i2NODE_879_length_6197_cov_56_342251_g551_i2_p3_ORF_typecomplete_len291_score58_94_NODE_879_length_6197_cov_56_342251_g551_i25261398